MPNDRETIAHEWFDRVWNQGDINTIDRLLADDAVAHGLTDPAGNELRGPAGFKPFFLRFREAFPDVHIAVDDTVVEGDKVAARCTVRGTHRGDSLGIAATHKPVLFTGICIIRVRNGQIVEAWNNFDFASMNTQLQAV